MTIILNVRHCQNNDDDLSLTQYKQTAKES
jgi:hypothetical protein